MDKLRKYGKAPFSVAVIHGGPGAAGEMAPVARELASSRGVLEPLQTAASLQGQVEELKEVLKYHGDLPVTLIGFSWGAWLTFIFAAHHPSFVKKLILVSSGPFEEKYAARIQETRWKRLSREEKTEASSVMGILNDPAAEGRNRAFARLGMLFSKVDAYSPVDVGPGEIFYREDIFIGVWKDASELRRSGRLLELGKSIRCPVVAVHGDHDPHPAEGVQKPLAAVLQDLRFFLLKHCGHKPWMEKEARSAFFGILHEESM